MSTEAKYQSGLIKRLRLRFPDCVILKNDPAYLQGVPDLVIFYGNRYALLEVKASDTAPSQPNQSYWIEKFDAMSFAAFVYPSNEEEVLSALERAFSV